MPLIPPRAGVGALSSQTMKPFTNIFIAMAFAPLFSTAQVVVESELTFRSSAFPGHTETKTLRLRNVGKTSQRYTISKSDLKSDCDSGYVYLPHGTTPYSNAGWIDLEHYSGELAPGEVQQVKVQLSVPSEFAEAAARSCLLVESVPVQTPTAHGKLHIRVRYAIGMVYRNPTVSGEVLMHAQRLSLDTNSGVWALQYLNAGNVDRIVSSRVRIVDASGQIVYKSDHAPSKGILPNQCRTFHLETVPKASLPPGNYEMVVLSETDAGEKFGVTKTLRWDD